MNNDTQWSIGPLKPTLNLALGNVHVWRILLPIEKEIKICLQKSLSQNELARLEKFHFEIDKERALVTRGTLRDILARYLNQTPGSIQFQYTELGKPFLNQSILNFNVSHSKNCILIALTKNMSVGIDVEYCTTELDFLSIAKEFLTQKEYMHFLTLPTPDRNLAFYRSWTRKEAILKSLGTGFSIPPNQIEVSENNPQQLSDIDVGKDYIAALASAKEHNKIFLWDWKVFNAY